MVQLCTLGGERAIHFRFRGVPVQARVRFFKHGAHSVEIRSRFGRRQFPNRSPRPGVGEVG